MQWWEIILIVFGVLMFIKMALYVYARSSSPRARMSKWKSTIAIASQTPEKRKRTTVITDRAHNELQQYLILKSDYVVI